MNNKKLGCFWALKYFSIVAAIVTMTTLNVSASNNEDDDALHKFGDIAQIALPAIGLAATYGFDDEEGRKQWFWHGITAVGTTTVLKGVYGKLRPNGDSPTSFPSGHTTAAFWGASFLDYRYGRAWGIPAYLAAGVTAYSRYTSNFHHKDDILMGASVGVMSGFYWVTPHDESVVSIMPYQSGDATGLTLLFTGKHKINDYSGLSDNNRWRYAVDFGLAYQKKNLVTAPADGGTTFDLHHFDEVDSPIVTAMATIEWYADRHRSLFSVAPFESIDKGSFAQPTNVGGQVFPAGETLNSSYRMTDVRLQYYFDLIPSNAITLEIGGGVSYQRSVIELKTTTGIPISSTSRSNVLIPLFNASAGYKFTPRMSLVAELGGLSLGDQKQLDANIAFAYRIDKYWDAGLRYGTYQHETTSDEYNSDVDYNLLTTFVGYSFY